MKKKFSLLLLWGAFYGYRILIWWYRKKPKRLLACWKYIRFEIERNGYNLNTALNALCDSNDKDLKYLAFRWNVHDMVKISDALCKVTGEGAT